uniref:Uncharacterized protein n=1 Tax=Enterovibrio sp. FF_113 TaxID=1660266 RepID=A0A0H3ZW87_9GAMM|nr:hypothetical protein [Enterovibrio sp. FF_113]
MSFGLQINAAWTGLLDANYPAEFVLAAGATYFDSAVYDRFGSVASTNVEPGAALVPITLTKYAIGMPMIGWVDGYHALNQNVTMVAGTTRGAIPTTVDSAPWASAAGNWSETDTTITIRNLYIPPCIDGSLTATRITGWVYVILIGTLPANYQRESHGIRMWDAAGNLTFDSSLMPANARHLIRQPTSGLFPYDSAPALSEGGLPSGVKMVPASWLAQGKSSNNYFCNMGIQFSSDGSRYGLRPMGPPWTNPWQTHYGMYNLSGGEVIRVFYASDYF